MEQTNALAEAPAPEVETTAVTTEATVSVETTPETETAKPRVFTQEELDAEIGKRLARADRKAQKERDRAIAEAVARVQPPKPAETQAPQKPQPESFKTTEDYLEALTDWKAEQVVTATLEKREKAGREAARRQEVETVSAEFQERKAKVEKMYPDWEEVSLNPNLPVTDHMANVIHELERGPEVLYSLGKNPAEAARIARLSPYLQAIELGRLETKLPEPKPVKKPSQAPEPINPVGAGKSGQPVFDTTDPRSTRNMSSSEWIEAENKRIQEQLRARGYR